MDGNIFVLLSVAVLSIWIFALEWQLTKFERMVTELFATLDAELDEISASENKSK